MKFGLACEGVTDYAVIKNILCGYFPHIKPNKAIRQLQPLLDESDMKQSGYGGWQELLNYLKTEEFYDAINYVDFIIIQIDSDVSKEKYFDVAHYDCNNEEFTPFYLIKNIITRLVDIINEGLAGFYELHSDRIIFAISVHSLECWLYAYYNPHNPAKPKIKNCCKSLEHFLKEKNFCEHKDYNRYKELSEIFLKSTNIHKVAQKDPGFKHFIGQLQTITLN